MIPERTIYLALVILVGMAPWCQPQTEPTSASARAFSRIQDQYGLEAERRFVRAYRHIENVAFHRLSIEFLQNREKELRKFLSGYPMAEEAHQARILLAQTLLYRNAGEEAESLLKMVILTTSDRDLEYKARFTLAKYYRRADPLKAEICLEEIKSLSKVEEYKARACYEISSLLKPKLAISVLREGGALEDGEYARRCRLKLARLTLRDRQKLKKFKPARPFRVKDVNGNVITHKDFEGDVYLIYFWSTYSPNTEITRSYLGALHQNHKEKGLRIIGVNMDGNCERLEKDVQKGIYPWTEVGDRWGPLTELALRYAPDPPPFFILVCRRGKIRFYGDQKIPDSATRFAQTPLWKEAEIVLRMPRDSTPLSRQDTRGILEKGIPD